jgi:hypothetical protein
MWLDRRVIFIIRKFIIYDRSQKRWSNILEKEMLEIKIRFRRIRTWSKFKKKVFELIL